MYPGRAVCRPVHIATTTQRKNEEIKISFVVRETNNFYQTTYQPQQLWYFASLNLQK